MAQEAKIATTKRPVVKKAEVNEDPAALLEMEKKMDLKIRSCQEAQTKRSNSVNTKLIVATMVVTWAVTMVTIYFTTLMFK